MAQLNFPNTRQNGDPLQSGDQYTGDNDVTYIFDGVKWVGHAVAQPAGTNSITNAGHTVQVDPTGNLVIPDGATIVYASGAPVVTGGGGATDRLTSSTSVVRLDSSNTLYLPDNSFIKSNSGSLGLANSDGNSYIDLQSGGIYLYTDYENNEYEWHFGANGILKFPVGEVAIGTNPDTQVTSFGAGVDGGGSISFSTTGNTYIVGSQNTVIDAGFGNDAPTKHWTFDTSGNLTVPQGTVLGYSDPGGFIIDAAGNKDVEIYTYNDSTAHGWTFGTDGYLTMESLHLQGYLKGVDGSTGSTGQVLTRQSNGGAAWADATGGSGGPVFQLTSGTAVVSLNTSGALTLPLGSQLLEKTWSTTVTGITTGTQTFVTFAANEFVYPEQGQITISGVDTPNDVNSTWYYQASDPNQVELHYNEDFASPVNSTSWSAYTSGGTVTLITQLQLNSNGNIWKFMADGSTIVPNGQRVIFGEQNGGSYIQAGMGFHINSTEGISLETVDLTNPAAPVSHGWYFSFNGTLQFPDSSIQTTSAQVQFRGIAGLTGAAGDTQGALAYSTQTNALYLATASYVHQVQTTSTHSLVTDQTILNGQDINGNLGFSFATASDPTLAQTLFDIAVGNVGGSITIESPAFDGVRNPDTRGINYGIDRSHFYIQIPFVSGDPGQINSGTTFTVTVTLDPVQPIIWNTIITDTHPGYQLTSGTTHLTVTNGSVGISPGTSIVFDQNTLGDQQGAYLGSGYYEVSDFTTTFFVSPGLPMLLGGAGVQIVDYTSLNDAGNSGAYNTAAAIFVGNTDATGGVEGIQDYNRTIGSVRVQSYNTATTSTYLWTFDNTGVLSIPGTISAGSTATVTSGVARTAWSNFLASQFNNSNSPFIVQDVQHDQAGNVIATLTDANTGTNQTSTITITTQTSMVVKYSPEGAVLWSQQITGPIAPATFGLAVDSGNNIYINLVDLATTTTTVVKLLGTDGSLVWATDLTDAGDAGFNALIGPDGNLVVNGVYNNAGSNNMYLMKINSTTGSVMWQKQLPDPGSNDIDTGLAIDPNSGNIAVSGSSQGANLGFVGIVNSNGNYVNGAEFTVNIGAGVCEVCDAIYDSQGHLYVSGAVSTASSVTAGFLAKIDTNLTLLWARQIGQGNGCIDVATSLVVDEHDNVYVSGFTSDPSQSGLPVTSLGSFAPDGTERWQYWFETPANALTSPGGLGAEAFQNSFADLGNNTSYHNGMIALGVISGYESNYYPYVLQVPADGTPVSFGNIGIPNMLPIHSTTSTWAAITATVTVTTGFSPTISAGTLTVATDVSVASAGISLGYNGTFEYDYTTSTVYTSQQSWQFKPDGGLTLPLNGFITAPSTVTINSSDGSTTHTWGFGTDGNLVVPGAIQSTNGIVISNAGVVGATAGIVLPANAGTGAVQIGNTYGPIQLGSAVGGGTELTWTFDTTGILMVPITASGAGQISGGTNGLQLVSNSNTWGFGTDATLTVPGPIRGPSGPNNVFIAAGDYTTTFATDGSVSVPGIINLPNGQGQIGNGGAGIDIICNVNSYGYITLNYLSQASVSVNTSGIVLTSNSSSWTFNSGSIQFPDATNQLTAFELQGVSQSPWGTTYPSSGGIANLDYQFYFDPTTGHPTIQSYSSNGGNPLYNSIWSYDAWLAASSSPNPTAGSSGTTPIQVNNTGGSVILSSVLQPGDYVTVRIQCIDTGRIFRATFMGSVNPNDFGITYGAITVERLL